MKKVNNKKGAVLVMLTILMSGLTSCEKTEIQPESNNEGYVVVRPIGEENRGGGDDEEDPIVDGLVQNTSGVGQVDAVVEIFEVGSNSLVDQEITDANGFFQMTVPAGNYYFKVTLGTTQTITNSFNITQNSNVVITI